MSRVRSQQDSEMDADFLRDFDLLTSISSEQAPYYAKADYEIGLQMMEPTYVKTEQNKKYKLNCHIDEFRKYGPGIYLMFKFLKYLTALFAVLSIFALSAILILTIGQNQHQDQLSNQLAYGILKTSIYNLTQSRFNPYVGLNFIIVLIVTIFLVYWSEKQHQEVVECLRTTSLGSYSTVIVKNLPENYNEHQLTAFLSLKYGQIAEVYTVRNFGNDLMHYKQMQQIVQDYKQQKGLIKIDQERSCDKIVNLFFDFREGHKKLKQQIKKSNNYKPCFTFVRFKTVQDRQNLLEENNKINFLCCLKQKIQSTPENPETEKVIHQFDQIAIKQCQMEPFGISWENIHLKKSQKVFKTLMLIFLMILILSISVFLIIILSVVQMSVSSSKYRNLSKQQIIKLSDNFALLSYCVNLSLAQFYQQSAICSPFYSQYTKVTIMGLLIPFCIAAFKWILTQLMRSLVNFRRYAYEIKKIQSQIVIIFVFYFMVTGPLQLFIYFGSQNSSLFYFLQSLIKQTITQDFQSSKVTLFSDYTPSWYLTAVFNIIIIGAASFNISAVGNVIYCYLREKIFHFIAKKQKIQIKMNEYLRNQPLEVEYLYAVILTVLYFTMLFGSSMPLLYIFACASFFILFWCYKYAFIRFGQKPYVYNHSINKKVRRIAFGSVIMHCIFAPIFYRADGIADLSLNQNIIQRITALWYYLVLLLIVVLYLCFEKPIHLLFPFLRQYFRNKSTNKQKKTETNKIDMQTNQAIVPVANRKKMKIPTFVRNKMNESDVQSYSMHENPIYKQILKTLYTINNKQRARKSCSLNQQLLRLYEDTINGKDYENQSRTLREVICLVRRDYKKFAYNHPERRNPYQKSKQQLYDMFQQKKKSQKRKFTLFFDKAESKQNFLSFER